MSKPTEFPPTQAVLVAFKEVRRFHPDVVEVVFDRDTRWHYRTAQGRAPKFDDAIDVGVLEDAQSSVVRADAPLPVLIRLP